MRVFQQALALAIVGLTTASMAQAATLTIPVQSGMIVDPQGTSCGIGDIGITSPASCEVHIPIALASGSRIQQINVIYGNAGTPVGSFISATLWSVDYTTSAINTPFTWSTSSVPSGGPLGSAHLMSQIGKAYPDAFDVQPTRLYYVDVYADHGFLVAGLQVTYQ